MRLHCIHGESCGAPSRGTGGPRPKVLHSRHPAAGTLNCWKMLKLSPCRWIVVGTIVLVECGSTPIHSPPAQEACLDTVIQHVDFRLRSYACVEIYVSQSPQPGACGWRETTQPHPRLVAAPNRRLTPHTNYDVVFCRAWGTIPAVAKSPIPPPRLGQFVNLCLHLFVFTFIVYSYCVLHILFIQFSLCFTFDLYMFNMCLHIYIYGWYGFIIYIYISNNILWT